ncbi:hypothetical protein ABZP36_024714 [Zizania latifolia]
MAAKEGKKAAVEWEWEWEGRVVSAVPAATADEAWALLSDFLAFHRWHPRVAKCRLASAEVGAPPDVVVRYCEGTPRGDGMPPDWAHETLLQHDAARRLFRYEMNDNNMGFGAFFATFRVVPSGAAAASAGCELRWEFECEPVRGTPKEALEARLQAGLDGMAARVCDHVLSVRAAAATSGVEAADELNPDNSIAV